MKVLRNMSIGVLLGVIAALGSKWWLYTDYADFDGQRVEMVGTVKGLFKVRGDKICYYVHKVTIEKQKEDFGVYVCSGLYPQVGDGDVVQLEGTIWVPSPPSYKSFLISNNVGLTCPSCNVISVEDKGSYMAKFKEYLIDLIGKHFWEPHASLLMGVLLGVDRGFGEDFSDALSVTGTSHIVVVSGYNVLLVANTVMSIASNFVKKKYGILAAILGIWLFAAFVGWTPPVVRACVMQSLYMIGMLVGRVAYPKVMLVVSIGLLLLYNPWYIMNVSFLMSVSATVGILLAVPIVCKVLFFIPNFLEESVVVGLTATLFTLPIVSHYFGKVSVVSIITNMLVLWSVEPMMVLGGIFLITAIFKISFLVQPISWLVWAYLDYFIKIVRLMSKLPFTSLNIQFSANSVLLYYFVLILSLFALHYQYRLRKSKFASSIS